MILQVVSDSGEVLDDDIIRDACVDHGVSGRVVDVVLVGRNRDEWGLWDWAVKVAE